MAGTWTFALNDAALAEGTMMPVDIMGHELALYRVGGEVFATQDRCSHGEAYLTEGALTGATVACPLHQGRFCIRTGAPRGAPAKLPLLRFAVRIDAGRIYIDLDPIPNAAVQ